MESIESYAIENKALRERLSRLCEASRHINESLEFEAVLKGVVDRGRSLTDAKYGLITLLDDGGQVQDCLTSGMTREETNSLFSYPEGSRLFEYFGNIQAPLRLRDFHSHTRALGLPEFTPPAPVSPVLTFMAAPIRHHSKNVGTFFVCEKVGGREFNEEDEETLVMFASQAALVIANARRYRDERRAKADLEALIDTSPVGVAVFDISTAKPVVFNREASRIFDDLRTKGSPPEILLEVLTIRRADGTEVSLKQLAAAQALSSGETLRAEEIVFKVPDGRKVTALVNATPMRTGDGAIESFVVTLQDMTPLEELERLRAEFLAMISHELRAPLNAISGSVSAGLSDTSSLSLAEIIQLFRIIGIHSERMSGLIVDLLDVARIETGTLKVHPTSTSITALVDQARNTLMIGGVANDIHVDLAPELPQVMADGQRIVQVLENLISNAAQNSPQNSPIRITAVLEGVYLAITVSDKGRGLSAERLPHLFRKFPRLNANDPAGADVSTGWGLAICKGIVEAHGGRIRAESDGMGTGSRFTFTIPVAEYAQETASNPPDTRDSSRARTVTDPKPILVVDDDPQTLHNVRTALSNEGYVPYVTSDPGKLPELMALHRPRLVLLDLVLPGTDGVEVMRDILEIDDVPIIFISAYGHDEAIARAFDAGADDYVVKPFSPTELAARIRAVLRRRTAPDGTVPTESFAVGDLYVDYARRHVSLAGRPVSTTDTEYRLLAELSVNAGRTLTHEHLLQQIWRTKGFVGTQSLRTAVKNLRRKLGDDARSPKYIFNEPRVGYRLGVGE